MSYPQVINEIAGAIHSVINVITGSVLKVLPVLMVIVIGLAAVDVFVGALFDGEVQTETPILSGSHPAEIQLSSNVTVDTTTIVTQKQ